MRKIIALLLSIAFTLNFSAQEIFYGDDYIVFEAEATNTPLTNSGWVLREKGDVGYQQYVATKGVEPMFDTYMEYTGPWAGTGMTALEYSFVCPKTANYRILLRMHQPLLSNEADDGCNDVFVSMQGDFESACDLTTAQLKNPTKMWGRGVRKWGSAHKLEINHVHYNGIYRFTEGETYTFTMKGRSARTCIDYILLYDVSKFSEIPQGQDVANFFPAEYRPGLNLVNPTEIDFGTDSIDLRVGSTMPLSIKWTPLNSKKDILWTSSDEDVLMVDENGVLTAVGETGEKATVKVKSVHNDVCDSVVMTLVDWFAVGVDSVSVGPEDVIVAEGNAQQMLYKVFPAYADNTDVTWTTSDESIATIDENGLLTAVSDGKVDVIATSVSNTDVSAKVELDVAELKIASIGYENEFEISNNEFVVGQTMPVIIDYQAPTLAKVSEVNIWLRQMKSDWSKVEKDYVQTIPSGIVGSESGTISLDIDLTGKTPTADLQNNEFYFLFCVIKFNNGTEVDKGIHPIKIIATPAGLEDNSVEKVKFYPNPANNYINIDAEENSCVTIYNTNGCLVYSCFVASDDNIDVSKFAKGVYFINFKSKNTNYIEKLIVE